MVAVGLSRLFHHLKACLYNWSIVIVMKSIIGILLVMGVLTGAYRFIDNRAYERGYSIGVEDGREDRQEEITPIVEDAISERRDILDDFYSLQVDYNDLAFEHNELNRRLDTYLQSLGQYNYSYETVDEVSCVSEGSFTGRTYNDCY